MKSKNTFLFHSLFWIILISSMSQALAQNKGGIVTDIQGNKYKTVVIGEQEWMAENLKTTKYNDGTDIPLITDMTDWVRTSTPAYSWYDNDKQLKGKDKKGRGLLIVKMLIAFIQ